MTSDSGRDDRTTGSGEQPQQSIVYPPAASPSAAVQATMGEMNERLQTVIYAAERAADAIRFDAEEQARTHLADAQQKADRLTAERVRLISDLTDDLIRHASLVRDHSEMMVNALEEAIKTVSGQLEDSLAQPASAPVPMPVEPPQRWQAEPPAPPAFAPAAYVPPPPPPPPHQVVESPSQPEPAPQYAPEAEPGYIPAPAPPPQAEPSAGVAASTATDEDALLLATRLAVGGSDRSAIAQALRDELQIADPEGVLDRVLGPA